MNFLRSCQGKTEVISPLFERGTAAYGRWGITISFFALTAASGTFTLTWIFRLSGPVERGRRKTITFRTVGAYAKKQD
ncbi:MAG: hypothetical protein IT172_12730 [Acidobacteria bacterium]|nr:hypothetical protein [Acidobacteriota bacterium]